MIKKEHDDTTALTRVEWMRARGYSEQQIAEYRKRQTAKVIANK
jgi:hypothetical protein